MPEKTPDIDIEAFLEQMETLDFHSDIIADFFVIINLCIALQENNGRLAYGRQGRPQVGHFAFLR